VTREESRGLDPQDVKRRFVQDRGGWPPAFEHLVHLDPEFVDAYREFSMVPWRNGALDARTREFIYIAIDISTTHLHADGARAHIAAARRHGATLDELIQVAELTVLLGIHTMTLGGPLLADAIAASGEEALATDATRREDLRDRYVNDRGSFPPPLEPVLEMDPDFIDAYRRLSAAATTGPLDAVTRELIVIALDASTTHLHATGTKAHIARALALGATPAQVLEVLEMTSVLGVHGTNLGVELVMEAFAADPDGAQ